MSPEHPYAMGRPWSKTYFTQSIKTNTMNFYILLATLTEEPTLRANANAATADVHIIIVQSSEEYCQ